MGRVIGGIGCSHSPALAGIHDSGKRHLPPWQSIFAGFDAAKEWLSAARPDLLIVCYNDHLNHFFFDSYPTFALGVADSFPLADEGRPTRAFAPLPGRADLGWQIARSLVAQEFDITICQEMPLDHGVLSPLPLLTGSPWPVPILPLAVNVVQHPLPTARRCLRLGQAIRQAVAELDDAIRVVVIGTGGLSHQLHGPDFGQVNPAWDLEFLDRLGPDPDGLAALDHGAFMRRGGAEAVEMIIWLIMRGALATQIREIHRTYATPALTGLAVCVLQNS